MSYYPYNDRDRTEVPFRLLKDPQNVILIGLYVLISTSRHLAIVVQSTIYREKYLDASRDKYLGKYTSYNRSNKEDQIEGQERFR